MYRAYVYFANGGPPENGIRLTTESFSTLKLAHEAFERLLDLPGVTGGDLETKVPRVGWVQADEAESAAWLVEREVD